MTPSLRQEAWNILSYNKIPPNKVSFAEGIIKVKVKDSAGPLVYKFEGPKKITEFFIKYKTTGSKKIESGLFDEDSVLRVGLVATGHQTLTGPKKWFAADWVKKLFSLAPKQVGLDKIYFFNVTNRAELIGKSRSHPKSDLIVESFLAINEKNGSIELSKKFEIPIETVAIWISIDGDDTQSDYETEILEMRFKVIDSSQAR